MTADKRAGRLCEEFTAWRDVLLARCGESEWVSDDGNGFYGELVRLYDGGDWLYGASDGFYGRANCVYGVADDVERLTVCV